MLESYFYHPNTAPFLAIHFIQRFGTSNPSPRYVNAVATALKNGIYEYETSAGSVLQYGSGKYGDMAALTASVLFDREARSVVMDLDLSSGSLREPLLKVTNVFRSMEYEPFEDVYQFTRYGRMISNDVTHKIGQMAFDIQSVFSFFRREFIPTIGPVGQASLVSPGKYLCEYYVYIYFVSVLYFSHTYAFHISSCFISCRITKIYDTNNAWNPGWPFQFD